MIALKPSTSCMYSEMKKNIENSDAPISRPTTLAPVNVRRRKIPEGHQRRGGAALDRDEGGQQRQRPGEQAERLGRTPAGIRRLDQP